MSAGDSTQEPNLEVLNGIIIASIWKRLKCCIVLTDSLPYPLDEVIQRDVRGLAFANNSQPNVRVGYLVKNFRSGVKDVPFFSINPWSQEQKHEAQYHTVSVDSSRHQVTGLGYEPRLNLIRDALDIMAVSSTKESNMLACSIDRCRSHSHSNRLASSGPPASVFLENYLQSIGYCKVNSGPHDVAVVLKLLIGPSLVAQLQHSNTPELKGILPALLKHKTVGTSEFKISPTKSSASCS